MSRRTKRSRDSVVESCRVPSTLPHDTKLTWILMTAALAVFLCQPALATITESNKAVSFVDLSAGLTGVTLSDGDWGDYDNDGDLDLALMGSTIHPNYFTKIYRNDAGIFTEVATALPDLGLGCIRWGDYDNDGDLDLYLSGRNAANNRVSGIYRNDAGVFTDIAAGLPALMGVRGDWGDYDNDGDLDLLHGGDGLLTERGGHIYRNDAGNFVDVPLAAPNPLSGVLSGSLEWGDFDGDGDLDVLLAGGDFGGSWGTRVIRNDAGVFTDHLAGLPGGSSATWGDYDNDGDPDILRAGWEDAGSFEAMGIHRNDAGVFTQIATNFSSAHGDVQWGDYDNDGDLDIAMTGTWFDTAYKTKIYRNDAGTFLEFAAGLEQLAGGFADWGDYDNDGDLDLLLAGARPGGWSTKIYRNDSTVANTPPSAPNRDSAFRNGDQVTFSWFPATDGQTPQSGLQYNLRVGSTPGGQNIVAPMSSSPDGFRRIVRRGNCGYATTRTVTIPIGLDFYWSVQAIDTAFEGSPFGFEGTSAQLFSLVSTPTGVSGGQVDWGDYDGDGDLDIVFTGLATPAGITRVYRNDAGVFNDANAAIADMSVSSADWGDYDRDGDLDLALVGIETGGGSAAKIYRNDAGSFTDIGAPLNAIFRGSADWLDLDRDGDLDLLVTGLEISSWVCRLYRNDYGNFVDASLGLAGLVDSAADWGDYDRDGDLDLALSGADPINPTTRIYRNDAGLMVDSGAVIMGLKNGSLDWGDYDQDGDLDLLVTGDNGSAPITGVYRNDAGVFVPIPAAFLSVKNGCARWGDYDNDGDLDIVLTGENFGGGQTTIVYRNDGGIFVELQDGLPDLKSSWVAWGDYDGDGDLDVAICGVSGANAFVGIYRNEAANPNTPPNAPSNLQAHLIGSNVIHFSWDTATDAQTTSTALSYNLRVGNTPGGSELYSSMANLGTGRRRVAQRGPLLQTSVDFSFEGIGPIYWGVQAIDLSFAGSPFANAAGAVTAVEDMPTPQNIYLGHNRPNPFNPATSITFTLPRAGHCELVVYDLAGRRIRTLVNAERDMGEHTVRWAGKDDRGRSVASGSYIYRLRFGDAEASRRMMLIK